MRRAGSARWLVAVALSLACLLPAGRASAAGKTLRIASKAFTESVILAEILSALERAQGIQVEHQVGLGGTRLVWDALIQGAIDAYPEYSGTLRDEILSAEAPSGAPRAEAETIAWLKGALAAHGVGMSEPLGFNNTYAIGCLATRARALGITRISELRTRPDLHFGFSSEFLSRRDGWPALAARYALPQTDVTGLDHDLAYRALQSGSIDATDLYTTDAEIGRYGFFTLADDLGFFKRYDAIILYRLDLEARFGTHALAGLRDLQGRISAQQMTALNARAKLDRVPEATVAAEFLQKEFSLRGVREPSSVARSILARTLEHLWLVSVSLGAAILVAVPLAVWAAALYARTQQRWPAPRGGRARGDQRAHPIDRRRYYEDRHDPRGRGAAPAQAGHAYAAASSR